MKAGDLIPTLEPRNAAVAEFVRVRSPAPSTVTVFLVADPLNAALVKIVITVLLVLVYEPASNAAASGPENSKSAAVKARSLKVAPVKVMVAPFCDVVEANPVESDTSVKLLDPDTEAAPANIVAALTVTTLSSPVSPVRPEMITRLSFILSKDPAASTDADAPSKVKSLAFIVPALKDPPFNVMATFVAPDKENSSEVTASFDLVTLVILVEPTSIALARTVT